MKLDTGRRVLFVVTEFGRGGAETQILRVGRELRHLGWHVSVLSLMAPEGFVQECAADGIALETLEMTRGRASARALGRAAAIVKRERPAVLVAFLFHAVVLGAVVAPLMSVPVRIASVRDSTFGGPRNLRLLRLLLRARVYDRIVTNSVNVRSNLIETHRMPQEAMVVVPNGIDASPTIDDEQRQRIRANAFGVGADVFQWFAVGNFRPEKDYPTLVAAFRRAAERDHAIHLALAGKGEPPDAVRALLQSPLGARVRFLGQRHDVRQLLPAADALVLSSTTDAMPNVVMEALSAGIPVVATNVDGVPEMVDDGVTGTLVPPRDPQALADAMLALSRLPAARRRAMGDAGRREMQRRFDVGVVARQWADLFEQLLC